MKFCEIEGPFERLMRVLGWMGFLAIIALSLVPGDDRPHTGMPGQAEHIIAYSLTSLAFGLGYVTALARIRTCLGLSIAAGSFEIVQLWIPGRTGEVIDWVASTAGTCAGMFAAWLFWIVVKDMTRRFASP